VTVRLIYDVVVSRSTMANSYSDIFSAYKNALNRSHDIWKKSVTERGKNAEVFYNNFFKDLIVNNGEKINQSNFRSEVIQHIKKFFGKDELNFVAVDGSNDKHQSAEFLSFYGGAYGARGTLKLSENPPVIEYKRWEIERDVTMVAFVPIPYSQLGQIIDQNAKESFSITDKDAIDITHLDGPMMQLAEIFLAYNSATSSLLESPDLIMIDNNVSGILGTNDFSPDKVRLVGYPFETRHLEKADAAIAQAHPFNEALGIPDAREGNSESSAFALLRYFHHSKKQDITLPDLEKALGIPKGGFPNSKLEALEKYGVIEYNKLNSTIKIKTSPKDSWEYTKLFFQRVCKKIFIDKEDDSLMYDTFDTDGNPTKAWMAPDDIRFLIAIGTRALIEECWEKNILLIGIVKDSASEYMKRNYLGICQMLNVYPQLTSGGYKFLPPTDRGICEVLPYIDDKITSPWSTIEFDSAFMLLHMEQPLDPATNKPGSKMFAVGRGDAYNPTPWIRPERLFLRSICQFFTQRKNNHVLTGHAVFVDRLAYPELDKNTPTLSVSGDRLGKINVLHYKDNTVMNVGQTIMLFLIDVLTRNHYPNVIGHPDPLHKADLGAKAVKDNIKKLLISSEIKFRSDPLVNTLREIRDSGGRGRR